MKLILLALALIIPNLIFTEGRFYYQKWSKKDIQTSNLLVECLQSFEDFFF